MPKITLKQTLCGSCSRAVGFVCILATLLLVGFVFCLLLYPEPVSYSIDTVYGEEIVLNPESFWYDGLSFKMYQKSENGVKTPVTPVALLYDGTSKHPAFDRDYDMLPLRTVIGAQGAKNYTMRLMMTRYSTASVSIEGTGLFNWMVIRGKAAYEKWYKTGVVSSNDVLHTEINVHDTEKDIKYLIGNNVYYSDDVYIVCTVDESSGTTVRLEGSVALEIRFLSLPMVAVNSPSSIPLDALYFYQITSPNVCNEGNICTFEFKWHQRIPLYTFLIVIPAFFFVGFLFFVAIIIVRCVDERTTRVMKGKKYNELESKGVQMDNVEKKTEEGEGEKEEGEKDEEKKEEEKEEEEKEEEEEKTSE